MEQTKALNALEPFLALTKSASSPRAAADLVIRATSAANTFIFSELLLAPQIQALLGSPEYKSHLTLLQIFSYGTYETYITTSDLPPLNAAQLLKLKQLSFLSLASKPENLSYANLIVALGLKTQRELEDVVISAIYAGLVSATLDPYHQLVSVSSVSPLRDLQPNTIPSMLSTLNEWSSRCNTTLLDLEKQIATIKSEALRRHKEEQEWAMEVDRLVDGKKGEGQKDSQEGKGSYSGGGGLFSGLGRKLGAGAASKRNAGFYEDDEDDMDLDDEDEDGGGRAGGSRGKKRGFVFSK